MIISIHEYKLKPGVNTDDFENAIAGAKRRGLFQLPGLVGYHFLRGLRGERKGSYAAIWVYASQEAWENLWGPPDQPNPPELYPQEWLTWENEYLAQYLDCVPDQIQYTSYLEIESKL